MSEIITSRGVIREPAVMLRGSHWEEVAAAFLSKKDQQPKGRCIALLFAYEPFCNGPEEGVPSVHCRGFADQSAPFNKARPAGVHFELNSHRSLSLPGFSPSRTCWMSTHCFRSEFRLRPVQK